MSAMPRITLRPGVVVNRRTAAMLDEVERRLGVVLPVSQGSYNAGKVSASAGTHDGGGVVDVPAGLPGVPAERIVLLMRQVGFAAWHRTPAQGPWNAHVHAVAIGDREMSTGAAAQVRDYLRGRNGLANHGPDDGPDVGLWRRWPLIRRIVAVRLAEKAVRVAQRDLDAWRKAHQ